MSESDIVTQRGIYKRIRCGLLLILIFAAAVGGTYFAWYRFSDQEFKSQYSKFESEVRRIERNARVGYHFRSDPEDTSPFGVLRFTFPAYDKFNDGELIEMVRAKFHPNIPKTDFHVWMRDPYGQEKIDSYVEHHKEARN